MGHPAARPLLASHGCLALVTALRARLAHARAALAAGQHSMPVTEEALLDAAARELQGAAPPAVRPVFNLTGTILLTRSAEEVRGQALRLLPAMARLLPSGWCVEVRGCASHIGEGASSVEWIESTALVVRPLDRRVNPAAALQRLECAFRSLPVPVIGRLQEKAFWLDLRALEDERGFAEQLPCLRNGGWE